MYSGPPERGHPGHRGCRRAGGCQGLCKHLSRRARATSRVLGAQKSWEAERSRSREVGGCPGRGAPRLVLEAAWGCRATEAGKPGLQPGRQGCPRDRRELPGSSRAGVEGCHPDESGHPVNLRSGDAGSPMRTPGDGGLWAGGGCVWRRWAGRISVSHGNGPKDAQNL